VYKTQLIERDEIPDFAEANETGITGDVTDFYIRRAVEWELSEAWENQEIDLVFGSTFRVAVWRDDVLLGVYTMDAEEKCPEWRNLTKVVE
jgi:hypothetical protein